MSTKQEIEAPVHRVWSILEDLGSYREWNPFIVWAAGEAVEGEQLALTMRLRHLTAFTLRPEVMSVKPDWELRWRARTGLPLVLDIEYSAFVYFADTKEASIIDQSLRLGGVAAPAVFPWVAYSVRSGLERMGSCVRIRAEGDEMRMPDIARRSSISQSRSISEASIG
jgi:hypothetical protein